MDQDQRTRSVISISVGSKPVSCADPESFIRGGPTSTTFFFFYLFYFFFSLMRGGRIQIPLLVGHQRPASETPFNGVSLASR